MAEDNLLKYKIALEMIPKIGSVTAKRLIAYCGGVEAVFNQPKQQLLKTPGVGEVLAEHVYHQKVLDRAEKELLFIDKYGIRVLYYLDPDYPARLAQCEDSPVLLYYKGNADLSTSKILSIVGTRNATSYGRSLCNELISGLVELGHNVTIVSGLAHGIDTAAHRGALKNGLPTVGVLAHGLDRIYPSANTAMAKEMLKNGALITDFITGTEPERQNFLQRNRIIAGMADATLVVESGVKGGALVTANLASSYNRDVLACPGRICDNYSQGCNALIKQNKAALVESAADIEYALNWSRNEAKPVPVQLSLLNPLSEKEQKIFDILKNKEKESIDNISFQAGLSMSDTSATLLSMEFGGILESLPGKMYSLTKSYRNT